MIPRMLLQKSLWSFMGYPTKYPPASFSLIADGDLQVIDDQLEQVLKK